MSDQVMTRTADPMFSETLRSFAAFMRSGFDIADVEIVAAKFEAAAAEVERLSVCEEDHRRIFVMSEAWGDPANAVYQKGDNLLVKRVRDLTAMAGGHGR